MASAWVLMYWILWTSGGFIQSGQVEFNSAESCQQALAAFNAQYMAYSNVEHGGICVHR